jgi:hypothetical protein
VSPEHSPDLSDVDRDGDDYDSYCYFRSQQRHWPSTGVGEAIRDLELTHPEFPARYDDPSRVSIVEIQGHRYLWSNLTDEIIGAAGDRE